MPGRFFEMPQHFRIGIGCETAMLKEGLERLGKALDEIAGLEFRKQEQQEIL